MYFCYFPIVSWVILCYTKNLINLPICHNHDLVIKYVSVVGLGPNSISNLARKLGLVVYLMNSSVNVDTILMNVCYLFNKL